MDESKRVKKLIAYKKDKDLASFNEMQDINSNLGETNKALRDISEAILAEEETSPTEVVFGDSAFKDINDNIVEVSKTLKNLGDTALQIFENSIADEESDQPEGPKKVVLEGDDLKNIETSIKDAAKAIETIGASTFEFLVKLIEKKSEPAAPVKFVFDGASLKGDDGFSPELRMEGDVLYVLGKDFEWKKLFDFGEYIRNKKLGGKKTHRGGQVIETKDDGTVVAAETKSFNFVGSGVSATSDGNGNITVTISGGGGGGGMTELAATGGVNGLNKTFTFTELPTYIVIDHAWYKQLNSRGTTNWTWNGGTLTATLTFAPTEDIFGIV